MKKFNYSRNSLARSAPSQLFFFLSAVSWFWPSLNFLQEVSGGGGWSHVVWQRPSCYIKPRHLIAVGQGTGTLGIERRILQWSRNGRQRRAADADQREWFVCDWIGSPSSLFCTLLWFILLLLLFVFFIIFFPVNCSYLSLWCLPFVSPVILSSHQQGRRSKSAACDFGVLEQWALNCRVWFRNHIT